MENINTLSLEEMIQLAEKVEIKNWERVYADFIGNLGEVKVRINRELCLLGAFYYILVSSSESILGNSRDLSYEGWKIKKFYEKINAQYSERLKKEELEALQKARDLLRTDNTP